METCNNYFHGGLQFHGPVDLEVGAVLQQIVGTVPEALRRKPPNKKYKDFR